MQRYQTTTLTQLQAAEEGFSCRFLADYRQFNPDSTMVVVGRGDETISVGLECIELDSLRFGTLYEWMGTVRRPSDLQQEDNNWPPVYVQAKICRDASGLDVQLQEEVATLKADFLARFMAET